MSHFETIRKSLLIVESDDEKRNLLLTYFKKGVECDAVATLDYAVDAVSRHEYSAVLAPLMPPELKGLELIPKFEKLAPNTVLIFTSEVESAGNTVKAYRAGAFDVVQMPMSLHKLECAECDLALKLITVTVAKGTHLELNKGSFDRIFELVQ
jgi:two-component system response regulator PilR (NtrC family)